MKTRRTTLRLLYEDTDISQDIAVDLKAFEYTDNETGKADDISLTLKDENGIWAGPWYPSKGATVAATIIDEFPDREEALYCGKFKIDDLSSSGPPSTFTMKGVSIPLDQTIRREKKSSAWEDAKLSRICRQIAESASMTSFFDVSRDPQYDRIDQRDESDLGFLKRICESEGYSLKVSDSQIIVFEQQKYEQRPTIGSIVKGTDDVKGYSFDSQAYDLYSECTCSYYDSETETLLEKTFRDPNITDGMKARLVKRAQSLGEAERLAKNELRKRNKHEVTGTLTLKGSTRFVAGVTVDISGFGKYDGKYIIEGATHAISNGYTVKADVRRVLEGY